LEKGLVFFCEEEESETDAYSEDEEGEEIIFKGENKGRNSDVLDEDSDQEKEKS
jgi:hypothetical protein